MPKCTSPQAACIQSGTCACTSICAKKITAVKKTCPGAYKLSTGTFVYPSSDNNVSWVTTTNHPCQRGADDCQYAALPICSCPHVAYDDFDLIVDRFHALCVCVRVCVCVGG